MRLLDLFCGAGGAAMGYHRAGFNVEGVDHKKQPRYPFKFYHGDALRFLKEHGTKYDVIHASPPCQAYSQLRFLTKGDYPDLIEIVREYLKSTGKPYVIENVPGAPLENYVVLCGSMFPDLKVFRHRLFECRPEIIFPPLACNHGHSIAPRGKIHNLGQYDYMTITGANFKASDGRKAMGIDWMTRDELAQAVPPAYTEWIGNQLQMLLAQERFCEASQEENDRKPA